MVKTTPLILLGVALILLGLLGPWFNYDLPQRLEDSPFANAMAHISVSPFTFSATITSTSSSSLYEDIEVLHQYSVPFYSLHSSLVGLICIISSLFGFVAEYVRRSRMTLVGGFVSLMSTLFFFFLLPSDVIFIGIKCSPMWGFWLSLLGSLIVIFSKVIRESFL